MKTVGIIAEYNPFHNGHAYQIKKIKEQTGADFVIIALSGDFVQRGAPALIDKYARTQMALSCGADLVLELPVLWSASSAENFALAGVTLFDKLGCTDGLCFGAETDNLPLLSSIAEILAEEPAAYQEALSSYLKAGMNFPAARARALEAFFHTDTSICEILNNPNNILAIEYLKALRIRNSSITPLLLKREGAAYHEPQLQQENYASATAIRNTLFTAFPDGLVTSAASDIPGIRHSMPQAAWEILDSYCRDYPLMNADDFSMLLGYRLLSERSGGYAHFYDANTDISNRLAKNLCHFLSFTQFCEENKSRDITYTRMSRILLHLLLGITNDDFLFGKEAGCIPYLRLLGFRKDSSALLSRIKQTSRVPMISKLANADKILTPEAQRLLQQDIFAADLYEQTNLISHKKRTLPRSEYAREIVLL